MIKERSAIGDQHEYINLIQAQLSNHQLAVLFYNCISNISLDSNKAPLVKELYDNYGLFQNIPQPVLVHPSHQKFYPNTCFKDKYEA